ncbi:MAG TPA: hypothetical protein VN645_08780 [Steroidobacteraceae bacterium]|nr:hypothetical protein [Steroidobacteraceae bacterium]
MEKHTVNEHPAALSLQRSREELRQVLMPRGPDSRNPPGQFPRSAVMQFLLNPRQRKVGMLALSALMLLVRRRGAIAQLGWMQLLRPLFSMRAR